MLAELHVTTGPDSGRVARIPAESSLTVGRGEVDFRLTDRGISRRHFRLYWQDESLRWKDLGSSHGTRVLGGNRMELRDGDLIGAGNSSFLVKIWESEKEPTVPIAEPPGTAR